MSQITLIAAMANNGCIGINNTMPWYIPEDFAFFKQYTLGKTVLMGRKTWDSLPKKPLPNRRNIVLSRQPNWQADGAERVDDLHNALALLATDNEIVIMGGAQIYTQAMAVATDLRITEVDLMIAGDAFFPTISLQQWQEVARIHHHSAHNGVGFDFVHYQRMPTNHIGSIK